MSRRRCFMTGDPSALGIGAASFWSRSVSGGDKRYSGKPDGGAVSGAGTPREETQKFRISKSQKSVELRVVVSVWWNVYSLRLES